ncbi:MAG: hypothetical protein ACKVTZ_01725 [Bacteroidia bacterium]
MSKMKPQDIVILVKLLLQKEDKSWTYQSLASQLNMSSSTIHASLERSHKVNLYSKWRKEVFVSPFLEFLFHGLKYVFPAEIGEKVKGIPTAHSAKPLADFIITSKENYVWKTEGAEQEIVGYEVSPLYKNLPNIVKNDINLYEAFALIDALRVGKAREKNFAQEELTKRLKNGK